MQIIQIWNILDLVCIFSFHISFDLKKCLFIAFFYLFLPVHSFFVNCLKDPVAGEIKVFFLESFMKIMWNCYFLWKIENVINSFGNLCGNFPENYSVSFCVCSLTTGNGGRRKRGKRVRHSHWPVPSVGAVTISNLLTFQLRQGSILIVKLGELSDKSIGRFRNRKKSCEIPLKLNTIKVYQVYLS